MIKYKHMMVDLETLGLRPDAVVFQVGITLFCPTIQAPGLDHAFKSFGWYLNTKEQLDLGRRIETDTLNFWLSAGELFKHHLSKLETDAVKLHVLRGQLRQIWLEMMAEDAKIWANGIAFDIPMLEGLMEYDVPWKYSNVSDYRTLRKFHNLHTPNGDTKHDAVSDSLSQAKHLVEFANLH